MFRKSLPSFALHFVRTKVEVPLIRFFFSSRRRHTSSLCDGSSDVCSSDLAGVNYWIALGFMTISAIILYGLRSEERRVGKECRSRWSPYHSKKKQTI